MPPYKPKPTKQASSVGAADGKKSAPAPRKKTRPAAVRAKISAALRGRPTSPVTRARLTAALQGHTVTAATRAKISAALRGRKVSEATKAKMRGQKRSEAVRARMSLARRGPRNPNYKHGLYATPEYLIETPADRIQALSEKQARLSAFLDQPPASIASQANLFELHGRNASKLGRLFRDQQAAQADLDALQALLDSASEILEEMEKEGGEEK